MNYSFSSFGVVSLYMLTGFFGSLIFMSLAVSTATPFYEGIFDAVENSPIASVLVSIPVVVLLGILIDAGKFLVVYKLLKKRIYSFETLDSQLKERAVRVISETIHIRPNEVQMDSDLQLLTTRLLLLPHFEVYKNHDRWLHDLFENLVVTSVFGLFVVFSRLVFFSLSGFDWAIILICGLGGSVFMLRLNSLRKSYTLLEVNQVIHQASSEQTVA